MYLTQSKGHRNGNGGHGNGGHRNRHHRRHPDTPQTLRLLGDYNAAKALRTEALAAIRAERAEIYRTARQLGVAPKLLRLLSRV